MSIKNQLNTREDSNVGNEGPEKALRHTETKSIITKVYASLPVITLNVNGLSSPNKDRNWQNVLKTYGPTIYCLQKTHFRPKDTNRLKVKGWKRYRMRQATEGEQGWLC